MSTTRDAGSEGVTWTFHRHMIFKAHENVRSGRSSQIRPGFHAEYLRTDSFKYKVVFPSPPWFRPNEDFF